MCIVHHTFNYESAFSTIECDNLDQRRVKLCENFAKKAIKQPKHTNWFYIIDQLPHNMKTRSNPNKKVNKLKFVQTTGCLVMNATKVFAK